MTTIRKVELVGVLPSDCAVMVNYTSLAGVVGLTSLNHGHLEPSKFCLILIPVK